MIKKTKSGYKVVSHSGKNLSAADLSLGEAKKRLGQVEFFKHHKVAKPKTALGKKLLKKG